VRRLDGDVKVPAKSTVHAVLDRHGLVKRGGGPRHRARGTPLPWWTSIKAPQPTEDEIDRMEIRQQELLAAKNACTLEYLGEVRRRCPSLVWRPR
jgi:hypothetical protein